jgi:hypothetical protein
LISLFFENENTHKNQGIIILIFINQSITN